MNNTPFTANDDTASTAATPEVRHRLLSRLGVAAFAFFLIKGLAWLVVPALLALGLVNQD